MKPVYHVIGTMSGTSLDGLDVAFCRFEYADKKWSYNIIKATTYKYSKIWKTKLSKAANTDALEFSILHNDFGMFCGNLILKFIKENKFNPDFICSHGHTVFHQPKKKLTVQIGSGASIAAVTGITTVCDFRTTDVALGGQGAPLVPIGDKLLFAQYDICLNIGGFSNLSFTKNLKRIAFDVCPANIALNYLANKAEKEFDNDGNMASNGKICKPLLHKLDGLNYYKDNPPKSLGKEWLDNVFIPVLESFPDLTINDLLRTCTEHIARQIATQITQIDAKKVLVTGGGAFNTFLMNLVRSKCKSEIIIPEKDLVNYKEALIFALLGVLRIRGENNCLCDVTGAKHDNCGGAVYLSASSK